MYRLIFHTALLPADEYIRRYRDPDRFIPLCEACPRYGNCWACPPYDYDPAERIAGYRYIHLLGAQIVPAGSCGGAAAARDGSWPGVASDDPGEPDLSPDGLGELEEERGPDSLHMGSGKPEEKGVTDLSPDAWTAQVLARVRSRLDPRLLALEREYTGSRALFAGTCSGCPAGVCPRTCGEPCVRPERVRPSLEAYGFDVAGSAAELLHVPLLWSDGGQRPEYLVLVSGFLTDRAVPGFAARFGAE